MAWLYNNKTIQVGRSWTDSKGVKHPRTWSNWTEARKKEMGMTFQADPVVASFDSRFYSAPNVAKPLNDTPAKDAKGNAVMDLDGTPMITEGLKTSAVKQAKATAAAMLRPTDWYVTRYAEVGTEVPAEVLSQREAIRSACGAIEAAISGATTHAQFIKLYEATVDAQGEVTAPAPINNWPAE
jgi:hypothetical protein